MGALSDRQHPRLAPASADRLLPRSSSSRPECPRPTRQLTAATLVESDLRGVESHGVVRVPIYVERLRRGATDPRPRIAIARETRSTAVVDGGNGMGQVVSVVGDGGRRSARPPTEGEPRLRLGAQQQPLRRRRVVCGAWPRGAT